MTQFTHTETNKPGNVGDRPTVDEVKFRWEEDLIKEPFFAIGREYTEEDLRRYASFSTGEWHYTSCVAVATVSYPINNRGDRRLQEFTSSGLWGIESDCGKDYRREVETEELRDLISHLEKFGIDTGGIRWGLPVDEH